MIGFIFSELIRILKNPGEYMQPFSDAATDVSRNLDPKYLKEGEQILVGFEGPFVSRRVTPRDLLSSFIGSMVCVEGIVTKCTFSLPFLFFFGYSYIYFEEVNFNLGT